MTWTVLNWICKKPSETRKQFEICHRWRWKITSFPANGDYCPLLITFLNSLDPDQTLQNVGYELDSYWLTACVDPEGGRGSVPPKKSQNIGFLSNTGLDTLKNHKTTKPALNVMPSSTRQRNAIKMAFCLWADDGPFIKLWYLDHLIYHQLNKKKRFQIWTPPPSWKKLAGSALLRPEEIFLRQKYIWEKHTKHTDLLINSMQKYT